MGNCYDIWTDNLINTLLLMYKEAHSLIRAEAILSQQQYYQNIGTGKFCMVHELKSGDYVRIYHWGAHHWSTSAGRQQWNNSDNRIRLILSNPIIDDQGYTRVETKLFSHLYIESLEELIQLFVQSHCTKDSCSNLSEEQLKVIQSIVDDYYKSPSTKSSVIVQRLLGITIKTETSKKIMNYISFANIKFKKNIKENT